MTDTRRVIDSATADVTRTATITRYGINIVTYDVNETKTWNATINATRNVTRNATWTVTENVTRNATWAATRNVIETATWNALKLEIDKLL
jgi:hypothetical protein